MSAQRKIFRIEESLQINAGQSIPVIMDDDTTALRHQELMTQLAALRALLDPNTSPLRQGGERGLDTIAQGRELKHELDAIHEAIRRTKQEIGGLEANAFIGPQMARVGRELDAVIAGTEQATQNILKSAEDIDQLAITLSSLLKDGYAQGLTQDMRDLVVRIFEACNFQDLTGQRISNVVATLKFIEEHIAHMRDIWRNIEHVAPVTSPIARNLNADRRFLNGPKLPDDVGHSSQTDIDMIFDSN